MSGAASILTRPAVIAIAIGVPWLGAILVAWRREARIVGFTAALFSVAASVALLLRTPSGESLSEALMALFSCLTLASTLMLPKRDCTPQTMSGILLILGATLAAYSTDNLGVFLGAWVLTAVPFLVRSWFRAPSWRPATALLLSSLALALAIALIFAAGHVLSIEALRGQSPGGTLVFALLVAAVILRKGICPAQAWVADLAEAGPAIPSALLLNGHFGALLVARLILPLFPRTAGDLFPVLSWFAMATALYVAIRALTENSPRRLLSFLALSQSACILAGLESRTLEGITGALVHWVVVSVSTVGLFGILRLLEVRFGENLTSSKYLGLAAHAPRLAVSFAVFGLALVGLPGTLSFCSQDLLIHGTLMSHPLTGIVLPLSTAMNAVSVFRLFARLFLGRRRTGFTHMADALPRERWALAAGVLFVVLGGLFPNLIVAQRSAEADTVAQDALNGSASGLWQFLPGNNVLTKGTAANGR
ncbi:MAG TPA: proton-conducting transporter membrane subunit [Bryobacteraceae bacterium]|nr:proton-conducting transporter membrane subunit [Bryobacteraceae bacterium]